jgi:hypothetical protein
MTPRVRFGPNLRIQLFEIRVNQPLLGDFDELAIVLGKVTLALQRAEVDLPHDLDRKRGAGCVGWCGADAAGAGEGGPGHEGAELGLVGEDARFVGLDGGAAEDGRHGWRKRRGEKVCSVRCMREF